MRSRPKVVTVALLAIIALAVGPVLASSYQGEFCFRLDTEGANPGDFAIGEFGVSLHGDDHYSVNGRITAYEGDVSEGPSPTHGNAEIIDGKVQLSLTDVWGAGPFDDFGTTVILMTLEPDLSTGTFRALTHGVTPPSSFFGPEYEQGTVQRVADCVLP